MIATKGLCHSVFLLVYSSTTHSRASIREWVQATTQLPTLMATSLAVEEAAEKLMLLGLASDEGGKISVDESLKSAGNSANFATFIAIAKLLLSASPPSWLKVVVSKGVVREELIPTRDLHALDWLQPHRDNILLDIALQQSATSEVVTSWLGSVGEHLIFAYEDYSGYRPIHVSKISDSYGYDIESSHPEGTLCLEIKTALESTSNRFFISKNEVRTAEALGNRWVLVQVILDSRSLTQELLTTANVVSVRALTSEALLRCTPQDRDKGTWIDSAEITLEDSDWQSWSFDPPAAWSYQGLAPFSQSEKSM